MLLVQANYVLISRLLMPVAAFLLLVLIGRQSDQLLGEYALVTTFYFVMQTLPLLGLTPFIMREVARRPQAAANYFVTLGLMALVVGLVVNAGVRLMLGFAPYSEAVRQGVYVVGYCVFGGILAFIGEIILFSLGQARTVALTTIAENVLRLVASVVVLTRSGDVAQLMWVVFATRMLGAVVYLVLICGRATQRVQLDWAILTEARAVLPVFAAGAVLMLVMSRMDFFVLSLYAGIAELGHYAIAYRLLEIFTLGVTALGTAAFPLLSRRYVRDRSGFLHQGRLLVLGTLTLLVPVAIVAHVGSDLYVRWLFAEQYPDAVVLSSLIVLALPLVGLDVLCGAMLNASDHQGHDLRAMTFGGLTYAAGLLLLVPWHFGVGAVVALGLATAVQAGVRLRVIRQRFGPLLGARDLCGHVLLALGALWLAHHFMAGTGAWGVAGLAIALGLLYPLVLIVTGLFRPLRLVAQVWPQGPLRPASTLAGLMDRLVIDDHRRREWHLSGINSASPSESRAAACVVLYRISRLLHLRGWHGIARAVGRFNRVLTKADIAPRSDIGPGMVVVRPAGLVISGDAGANTLFDAGGDVSRCNVENNGGGSTDSRVRDKGCSYVQSDVEMAACVPPGSSVERRPVILQGTDLHTSASVPGVRP